MNASTAQPETTGRIAKPLRAAVLLILAVTLVRLVFLWCSPYELSADEAQYWDWSRRLELSYHTKGPGAAWTIFASTSLLGTSEFGVRAPAAIAAAVMMLALALLARDIVRRSMPADASGREAGRAAVYAVLVTLAIPAYHAAALLMTIDGPMLACWAVALLAAWRVHDANPGRPRVGRGEECDAAAFEEPVADAPGSIGWAAVLGIALGIGFLFKYTILLAALGIGVFFFIMRKGRARSVLPTVLVALIAFAACIAPVLIWNAQRGWPTIAHLLGHLGLPGSDLPKQAGAARRPYSPRWTLEYVGVLLAMAGPIVLAMFIAVRAAFRGAGSAGEGSAAMRAGALLALCVSLPVFVTYLVVSFFTDVEGNWPIGAWVSTIPIAASFAPRAMDDYRTRVKRWLAQAPAARTRQGFLRRKPETAFQLAIHLGVGVGVVAGVGMMFLGPLSRAAVVGPLIPIHRITGGRELAAAVDRLRQPLENETGKQPFIVGARYTHTALLAFYCKGRPAVFCAGSRLGDRRSAYDDFADTDLGDPTLLTRPAILVDAGRYADPERWNRALQFDQSPIETVRVPPLPDPAPNPLPSPTSRTYVISTARGYAGVVPR